MKLHRAIFLFWSLFSASAAAATGTFKLYDVVNDRELVTLKNKGSYDLHELGVDVGTAPQVTVKYEPRDDKEALKIQSVSFKLQGKAPGGNYQSLLSKGCDAVAPFYFVGSGAGSVPFDFAAVGQDQKFKIKVYAHRREDCKRTLFKDRITFSLSSNISVESDCVDEDCDDEEEEESLTDSEPNLDTSNSQNVCDEVFEDASCGDGLNNSTASGRYNATATALDSSSRVCQEAAATSSSSSLSM